MVEAGTSSPENGAQESAETLFERWLEQRLEGEGEEPEAFLAQHPALAPQVEAFLDTQQAFKALRAGLAPPEAFRLEPGQRLGEDYELLTELGRGGMGVVWLARQRSLNRDVAVKFLSPGLAAPARSNDRFVREAQVIAQLRHPGIVTVYTLELEPARGGPSLVMEYVPGITLDRLLVALQDRPPQALTAEELQEAVGRCLPQPQGPAPSPDGLKRLWTGGYTGFCCRVVVEAAEALAYAHERGVIHRDVKPSNILLGVDGRPRLLDFGLARLVEGQALTLSGELLGTPAYMAPEQLDSRRGKVTPLTDIYALGLVLYELVTLRRAFPGESPGELVTQITSRDPIPPRRLHPALHRDLEAIILKAIEKEPARRYPSAAAFAEDLHRFLAYQPVVAKPMGPVGRLLRRIRRHPGIALLVALLLLTTTGLGWLALSWSPSRWHRLLVEAQQLGDQGRLEEAIRLYQEVLRHRPHDVTALTWIGISFDQLGEPETAARYLEQALVYDPTNATALSALADIRADQERLDEAVALYQRALRATPSDTYTWVNLGDALARQRLRGDVVSPLRRQGFTEEELPKALFYLGQAYASYRQVHQACRVWLQARTFHLPDWKLRVALARELDKLACETSPR